MPRLGFGTGTARRRGSGPRGPSLRLSGYEIAENAALNALIGTISVANGTASGAFAIDSQTPAGKTNVSGSSLRKNATLNYDTNKTLAVAITDTVLLRTFTIRVKAVLGALALDASSFTVGVPASGSITGARTDEVITSPDLPAGLTIDSAARTWSWSGSGSAGSGTFSLIGTHPQATNSPHTSSGQAYTIAAGGGGGTPSGALTFSDSIPLTFSDSNYLELAA